MSIDSSNGLTAPYAPSTAIEFPLLKNKFVLKLTSAPMLSKQVVDVEIDLVSDVFYVAAEQMLTDPHRLLNEIRSTFWSMSPFTLYAMDHDGNGTAMMEGFCKLTAHNLKFDYGATGEVATHRLTYEFQLAV